MSWLSSNAPSSLFRTSRKIIRTGRLGLTAIWCSKHTCNYSTRPLRPAHPLRILFCGSDSFSERSLDALIKEHNSNRDLIQSIDVVVRPPKPVGRGMKELAPEGPVYSLATEHKLPVHEIDTFTGWNLPQYDDLPISLIIAVSFGLFVPPRLLRACQYGGLNVHPSLLPDLRGPAPLHHAILSRDTHTGVSLQTLSDKTFDAGAVLSQTPLPGIPIDPSWDVTDLTNRLAEIGSEMLVQGLRDGIYIPPHKNVSWAASSSAQLPTRHAHKLVKSDYQIQWDSWTAADVTLRSVKLHDKVWTSAIHKRGHCQRWSLDGVEAVEPSSWTDEMKQFARHVQERSKKQTGGTSTNNHPDNHHGQEETGETTPLKNLKTIILRQIPQPPSRSKAQARGRSIFNGSETPEAQETATTTTTTPSPSTTTPQPPQPPQPSDLRLPYFTHKSPSIIIPMPRGGFIRIDRITVEGRKEIPAVAVAAQFRYTEPANKKKPDGTENDEARPGSSC